ncbi:sugar ABC transporter substrate-binding protein [Planomonospora parontospora subsp. parontospora]|uniref:Sugar ABC transporter substrate-binding protein n=2 Tax=Planomonospora parontospora TaxID=58119 RepID=A0AA37F226_9ACTN|nr:extracellular solute-binding protein [Planomonospora parontospora]GGK45678.1 sugar ABC transporter substrate-binding protein [Planomonospora parontospora]GII06357.1 sugar ABC transporter substrate-binding protein [Planomonospora parontospora subsp. parontospora]
MRSRHRLHRASACLLGAALIGLTAACGTDAAEGGAGAAMKVWALEDPQNGPIIQLGIDQFNKASGTDAALTAFPNDRYGLKLKSSLGALNSPDVFFNWGGGNLAQFVKENTVADLDAALRDNPAVAEAFMPSVLEVGKVGGKQYGLPMNGIQPVVLFYNKKVFADAGLEPPRTYDDMLRLVDAFKARGVIPFALPGTQSWTELMWLEYLLERVGGPEKFAAIAAGERGAWSDPAVLRALEMCRELAERGAFGEDFASVNYDSAGAPKLLATGRAAMFLMGSWEYSSQLSNNPDFVTGGDLGWTAFPAVSDGAGDPAAVVGNPSNYFSVRSGTPATEEAVGFLVKTLTSDAYLDALVESGQVPAVKGVDEKLAGKANADFTTFTYGLVENAPAFTQSWDQALPASVSAVMLENLRKLFLSQITPEEYVSAMETAG